MNHRVAWAALAAITALSCGKSENTTPGVPAPDVTPDVTPPLIANPDNRGIGTGDLLRVRFTELVNATAATTVTVVSARRGDVPSVVTLSQDGVLEVAPLSRLAVPDTITVTVRNVSDHAGNLLIQGSARFATSGWADLGVAYAPVHGPSFVPHPEVAVAGGIVQVVWPFGRAWLQDGAWSAGTADLYTQSLARDGSGVLRAGSDSASVSLHRLDAGAQTTLTPALPADGPITSALAACPGDAGLDAVVAWHEPVGESAVTHTRVRAARWANNAWSDLGTLGGEPGNFAWNPSVACSVRGTASVVFEQASCDGLGQSCLRVAVRGPQYADWAELPPIGPYALRPALAVGPGEALFVAYTKFGQQPDVHVDRGTGSNWESLGVLDTDPSLEAVEASLAIDTTGALLAAWAEHPRDEPALARVLVKRWTGERWDLVGDAVNEGDPVVAGRAPRLAVGEDGTVVVSYLEWDGHGDPTDGAQLNYRIRVKHFVP